MSEGLATLSQIDYSWSHHFSSVDRDTYLARRFLPIGLDLREQGKGLPAIQLGIGEQHPDGLRTSLYTLWAYYKTSATLDHLRVTIGDEAFARGLTAYVKKCSYVGCRPDDFRTVLEETTGKNLAAVLRSLGARVVAPGGLDRVRARGGRRRRRAQQGRRPADDARAVAAARRRAAREAPRRPRGPHHARCTSTPAPGYGRVATSPRHDVMVDARSKVQGDLDFDGESDGIDLLRCTPLVGKTYKSHDRDRPLEHRRALRPALRRERRPPHRRRRHRCHRRVLRHVQDVAMKLARLASPLFALALLVRGGMHVERHALERRGPDDVRVRGAGGRPERVLAQPAAERAPAESHRRRRRRARRRRSPRRGVPRSRGIRRRSASSRRRAARRGRSRRSRWRRKARPASSPSCGPRRARRGIDASGETVLGTIVVRGARAQRARAIGFKSERSQLVDKKGVRVDATWAGGSSPAR